MKVRRGAAALAVAGIVALGWFAINVPAMFGPYGPLAIVLIGPYGLVALVALTSARGLWTERRWARPLGIAGSLLALAWSGLELVQYWPYLLVSLVDPSVSYNWANPDAWIPLPIAIGGIVALVSLIPVAPNTTPRMVPGVIGLLTVPVLAITGVLPIPPASLGLSPGLVVVVALAAIAAWIARGDDRGWLGYGLGLALGTLAGILVSGLFAASITVEGWLVGADEFRVNLAFTIILITAAAAIGYLAGAILARRLAHAAGAARPSVWLIALPFLAMAAVGLGSPVLLPERALLPAGASTVTLVISAEGRLAIEPVEFRAGPATWTITNRLDRRLCLVMVPVASDADVEDVRSGAVQGATFGCFAMAQPGSAARARFDTAAARYVIFFEIEGGDGGAAPGGLVPPERLVVVTVR
jgi:hypothetical protein